MKAYGGMDVYIHIFLTSALVGGEWSASRPGRFTPRIEPPVPIGLRVLWVGTQMTAATRIDDDNNYNNNDDDNNKYINIHVTLKYFIETNTEKYLFRVGLILAVRTWQLANWRFSSEATSHSERNLAPIIGLLSPQHDASSGHRWRLRPSDIQMLAANILNKQSRTADKGGANSLGVQGGIMNS
jgi:hypothetical protein